MPAHRRCSELIASRTWPQTLFVQATNGALHVVPGSHRLGKATQQQLDAVRAQQREQGVIDAAVDPACFQSIDERWKAWPKR